jgi:hypothetical protein
MAASVCVEVCSTTFSSSAFLDSEAAKAARASSRCANAASSCTTRGSHFHSKSRDKLKEKVSLATPPHEVLPSVDADGIDQEAAAYQQPPLRTHLR